MTDSIVISKGDGIGPEIMDVVLAVMQAAGADLLIHEIEVGEKVYLKGCKNGIEPKSWDLIYTSKAFLKAPITTPEGGGFRSLNVAIRTMLGLFANVRPAIAYAPFVPTLHPNMNLVIIRENEEDLYTGIEYRTTEESFHALKLMTYTGCERVIRYAFEYARANRRKKVTAFTKDNILKMTDGLFRTVFDAVGTEFPDIQKEHWIVDIGAAKLADHPEQFDVLVLPNLYGDILSDVAAEIAGSVGLAGSANIGIRGSMFEAIHGSAPRRAGQNLANPSGLLLAAVMMLEHLGQQKIAVKIQNGWLKTIEEGIHTYDIYNAQTSKQKVGTKEFGQAIIERLGATPTQLYPAHLNIAKISLSTPSNKKETKPKTLVGADFFICGKNNPRAILQNIQSTLVLTLIGNRGLICFPDGPEKAEVGDEWRARFLTASTTAKELLELHTKLLEAGLEVIGQQNLYLFDGKPGFS
jgi:isocitrate dehydrogenase